MRKFVFSEGGLKIFQLNRNLTKIGPLLEDYLEFGNGTLFIRVPTLSSKPSEVSGTGFAYLKLKYLSSDRYYINCSGSLKVKDAYFESFWHERMKEIASKGNLNFDNGVLSFENVNVSISAKEFQIALT